MTNLLYLLYFLPTIVCLLWAVVFSLASKTARQVILLGMLVVGIMYFSTYALYSQPDMDMSLVATLESFSLPSGVIAMELLTIFLLLHATRGEMRSYYLLILIPGLMFTASLTTLYSALGYDEVGRFFEFYNKTFDEWRSPYDTRLVRVFYYVDYYVSTALGGIHSLVNIGLGIYILYKEGYKPGGLFSFLLEKKRATPSRMVAFAAVVLNIVLLFGSVCFYDMLKSDGLHLVYSLLCALIIHLLCFAEYHSNLKVFTYNNLRKARMYDNIIEQKEKEEQEKQETEKARIDAVMQRDAGRSALVEKRRLQLSLRFHQLMEEEKVFLRDDISVDEVTRILGVGRTVLSNFINYEYGSNFRGVINDYRIKHAKEYMLQNPLATQETVALASGFKDSVSYTHKFKELTGMSPVAWLTSQEAPQFSD